MPNLYNAGQLSTIIQKAGEMDMEDLGADSDAQKSYIFMYMNLAMWELARLAYQVDYSDAITLSSDGFVTFKKSGSDISDLFEPLTLLDTNGNETQHRTSYSAPKGWWRDSQNQQINVKGLLGDYTLKYIRYPKPVTTASDVVEFPPSGYMTLVHKVLSIVKYSKNSYGGAEYLESQAKLGYNTTVQGSISARGTGSTGQPPSITDAQTAKG